jgi:hypothetical protein
MKIQKFTQNTISINYKGTSVSATGALANVITYSLAGLLILLGIAAIQKSLK